MKLIRRWGICAPALPEVLTDVAEVDVPVRKVDEEVVHHNIQDATASQSTVLYNVFGKIREWMEWEAGDQKSNFVPLRLTVRGAAGMGKVLSSISLPVI
jgi:hypothetical protein